MIVELANDRHYCLLIGSSGNVLPEDCHSTYRIVGALRKEGPSLREVPIYARSFEFDAGGRIQRDVQPANHALTENRHRQIAAIVTKEEHLKRYEVVLQIYEVHA